MNKVYQDTDIPNRISDEVVLYEAHTIHRNTITIDGCKCVGLAQSMAYSRRSLVISPWHRQVIITQWTKITHLHLLMPFGKTHMAPKEARIVQFNGNGTERQPPWTIFNILWNSTSFVFTELANRMKYGGGFLYNLVFTEWRLCASQNEVWERGVI